MFQDICGSLKVIECSPSPIVQEFSWDESVPGVAGNYRDQSRLERGLVLISTLSQSFPSNIITIYLFYLHKTVPLH